MVIKIIKKTTIFSIKNVKLFIHMYVATNICLHNLSTMVRQESRPSWVVWPPVATYNVSTMARQQSHCGSCNMINTCWLVFRVHCWIS